MPRRKATDQAYKDGYSAGRRYESARASDEIEKARKDAEHYKKRADDTQLRILQTLADIGQSMTYALRSYNKDM